MVAGLEQCTGGEHPTNAQGVTLCHHCVTGLEADLREAPFVWLDVQTTVARLDVGAGSVGSSGYKAPQAAVNFNALDKAQTLRVVLGRWASRLPQMHPAGDPVKTALWLITQMPDIRKQDWAGTLKTELQDALNACRRATDRAAMKVFAGMCPGPATYDDSLECATAVYTAPGRRLANCPACNMEWDVTEWRGRALDYARIHEGTAAELSRMLSDPVTGEALPQATIRQWVSRGFLSAIGVSSTGNPTYQVRKVRNLWARKKASKRGNPTMRKRLPIAA